MAVDKGAKKAQRQTMTVEAAFRRAYEQRTKQTELAKVLRVPQNKVSRWATGAQPLTVVEIAQVEDACGYPRGTILSNTEYVEPALTVEDALARDLSISEVSRRTLLAAYQAAQQPEGPQR